MNVKILVFKLLVRQPPGLPDLFLRPCETAITGLMSDILLALDAGDIAALALLDLSVVFDTVDHTNQLQRL